MNGFVWVRLGKANMILPKNKTRRDKNGRAVHISGPMAGEISPDIMFWDVWQKMVWMGADGHRPVLMGEDGCIGKEESKKEAKRAPHARAGAVLQCMYTVQKNK